MSDVLPSPLPKLINFPVTVGLFVAVLATGALLIIANYFDPTQGPLTISMLIIVGFLGAVIYCMIFSVPVDEVTSAVIGGLTAAFGAIIAYWLGQSRGPPK